MKKIITILICATCMTVTAIAQNGVRIGNLEFNVRKVDNDTVAQIIVNDPCPPCPPENGITQPKPEPKFNRRTYNDNFGGIGFIMPDIGKDDYYTVLGGNSINLDIGGMRTYHVSRRIAFGGTLNYSFYNYKFRNATVETDFNRNVLGGKEFVDNDVQKQVYRTHNISAGLFTRIYIAPLKTRNGNISGSRSRFYIDLGAQGDFAAFRYCMLNTQSEKKKRYHEDYAFNPFGASAIVRLGSSLLPGKSAIFARYRFTDAFNSKILPMDLPPLTIGIQFF